MNANDLARQKYIDEYPRFEAAARSMEELLVQLCRAVGIRAVVEVRHKSIGSFVKKIHIKKYTEPWTEITDKVGGRIVVGTLADLERTRALFEGAGCSLNVLSLVDKSRENDEDRLSYAGIHIQTVVPGAHTSDGERIECEIQLRTKAQDLWSVPSHELLYKGAIEPSKHTRRRVLRLSVLTELFDEEVRQAMNEIAADPRYAPGVLLRTLEARYLGFVGDPGEDELSMEVLGVLQSSLSEVGETAYAPALDEFIEGHRDKIADIYETYGVYSDFSADHEYILFSQPESLLIFERVSSAPLRLALLVEGTDLQSPVRHMFAAWGAEIPDVV